MSGPETPLGVFSDVCYVSIVRPSEEAYLFQEVSRCFNSLLIRIVQLFDIQTIEVAEDAVHPVSLLELLIHWKRLTVRRRG